MRVLHVSDCYLPRLGGIEMQVHDLAQRQRAAGTDARVVTATPKARHDLTADEVVDGVPLRRLSADLPSELPVHPRGTREIGRVLDELAPDVVHVHAGVVSPFAWQGVRAALARELPTAVTLHCLWGPAEPGFAVVDRALRWSRWPVAWSAVSGAAAAPLRRIVGDAAPGTDPVSIVPNGIDAAAWRVEREPRDPDDVRLVAVMRLAPRKRPLPLLRALAAALPRVPAGVRVRLTVVGEGPERRRVERSARRAGPSLAGAVDLPGYLPRAAIRDLYRRADAFVSPVDLESFGIAALEARCAGVPVVAKARSGIAEFVRDGVDGLLADTDADLAEALARLAADPALRERLAATSRAEPPPVTWAHVLDACAELYVRAVTVRQLAG